jgi:hypothetical protein
MFRAAQSGATGRVGWPVCRLDSIVIPLVAVRDKRLRLSRREISHEMAHKTRNYKQPTERSRDRSKSMVESRENKQQKSCRQNDQFKMQIEREREVHREREICHTTFVSTGSDGSSSMMNIRPIAMCSLDSIGMSGDVEKCHCEFMNVNFPRPGVQTIGMSRAAFAALKRV